MLRINQKKIFVSQTCRFCLIVRDEIKSHKVLDDELCTAFLDSRPLFIGHLLLIPKEHVVTVTDLPLRLIQPFFLNSQRLAKAVQKGVNAEGTLMIINNGISQSVPHLHLHIIPRRRKDGLNGFFWPRQHYANDEEAVRVQKAIISALSEAGQVT